MGRQTNKQRRERQAATARERAAAARAAARRQEQRRRALAVLSTVGVIAVVGVIVAVVAITRNKSAGSTARTPASPTVVSDVTGVSPASLAAVGRGNAALIAKPVADPALSQNGKPEFLYIGGEFCPFCAAERWAIVQALSRFGTFSNLKEIRSALTDGNIATFSFYRSTYTSKYLTFVGVENEDRARKSLEPLTSEQARLFSKYTNGFPFLDFGGKYVQLNSGFEPTDLSGLNQQQIAAQLADPTSKVAKDILGEANVVTAKLCKMTNNRPASVCQTPDIIAIQGSLSA